MRQKKHFDLSKQNSEVSLQLLKAQSQLYTKAKKIGAIRGLTTFGIAILSPILLSLDYQPAQIMAPIVAIVAIISNLVFKRYQKNLVVKAASIQEEFDTSLFQLSWNETLVKRVRREEIIEAANRYSGNAESLKDWYSEPGVPEWSSCVAICQRCNVVWDSRQSQKYIDFLSGLMVLLLIFDIYTLHTRTLIECLLQVAIPTIPALLLFCETRTNHLEIIQQYKDLEKRLASSLKRKISERECRQIQDVIFRRRSVPELVPDFWYKFHQKTFQKNMVQSTSRCQ